MPRIGSQVGPLINRLEARLRRGAAGGCWEWEGSTDKDGYGRFDVDGRPQSAHRLVYVEFARAGAPLPEGVILLHGCDNRRCVNPDHMRPGTRGANAADTWRKGRTAPPEGELTHQQVLDLRVRWWGGRLTSAWLTQEGKRLCLHPRTLARAARHESHKGLPPLPPPAFPLPEGVAYDPRPIHAAAAAEGWHASVLLPDDEAGWREARRRWGARGERRYVARQVRHGWPCWHDEPTAIEIATAELEAEEGAGLARREPTAADAAPRQFWRPDEPMETDANGRLVRYDPELLRLAEEARRAARPAPLPEILRRIDGLGT